MYKKRPPKARPAKKKASRTPTRPKRPPTKSTGFIVNDALEVVEFLGKTGPYLEFRPGEASLRLRNMVGAWLYLQIAQAVERARTRKKKEKKVLKYAAEDRLRKLNIEVSGVRRPPSGQPCWRVVLEDVTPKPTPAAPPPKAEPKQEPRSEEERLRQELTGLKAYFESIIEEQEGQRAADLSELQSSKDKLESTASELEVSHAQLEEMHAELEASNESLQQALSEREKTLRGLRESEAKVRALIETASQAVLAVEAGGRIGLVNETAEKMFGYSREELLGQPIEMLLPERFRRKHREHRREYFAHPRTRPMGTGMELFGLRKDGTEFPVEISLSHINPEDHLLAVAFVSDITERKRAEESRRQDEERLRVITDSLPVLISYVDADQRYQFNNATYEEWFGVQRHALKGRRVRAILGRAAYDAIKEHIQKALAGEPSSFEDKVRFKTAGTRDVHVEYLPHRDARGKVVGFYALILDITGRKRAEELLRESEERFRIAAESGHDLIYEWNLESGEVQWWGDVEASIGFRPKSLQAVEATLHPDDRGRVMKAAARHLKHGEPFAEEYRVRRDDGTYRYWADSGIALRNTRGKPHKWIGACTDITERKRAEEELRSQYAFHATLVDTLRALVVVLDRTGRIVRFNQACQQVTGYSFDEVVGRRFWDFLLVPEEVGPVKKVFRDLRSGRVPNEFENYWVTKNGRRRLISWANTTLLEADGTVKFVIGTGVDVTERRQAERALRESQQRLQELTYKLINAQEDERRYLARELHDAFSHRLAALSMEIGSLRQRCSTLTKDTQVQKQLQMAEHEMAKLSEEVHDISRQLHPAILEDLGLEAALRNECGIFSKRHGMRVRFSAGNVEPKTPLPLALVLYRVAQECLHNIRKHARAESVHMTLRGGASEIVLRVRDDGRGFKRERISSKGSLGLTSMEERVRAVDGVLSIESKPGQGTKVEARVPLPHPPRQASD